MQTPHDCFDVLEQNPTSQSQDEHSYEILYTKQSFASFKTQNHIPSLNSPDQSSDSEESEDSINKHYVSRKSKKVAKPKRSRKLNDKSKWEPQHQIKYWKFHLQNTISRPYMTTSWGRWKTDSIYKRMEEYTGKTHKQCKSKDQNLKSKNMKLYPGMDIADIALLKLQELELMDDEAKNMISQYKKLEKGESEHMRMLDQKLRLLERETKKIAELFI